MTKTKKSNGKVTNESAAKYSVNAKKPRKERLTVQISLEVIERVKNAVYWTPGLTLARLAEDSLSSAVDKLEKTRKEPFPKRKEELKTGRPVN